MKSLLRGTALYSAVLFAQRLASLILLPLNTHYLSPSDYGVLDLLEQTGVVLSVLMGLNVASALGFFYFAEDTAEGRRKVAGTVVAGALLVGLIAAAAGFALSGPASYLAFGNGNYRNYLLCIFLSMPFAALFEALFGWLRVTDRPGIFVIGALARISLTVILTVLLVAVFQLHVAGVLASSITAVVIPSLALLICFHRMSGFCFDQKLFSRIFRFSFPIGISSAGMFIVNFGDRFILSHYKTLAEVGIYAVAYKVGMLMAFIHNSFHTYWAAQVYSVVKRDDAEEVTARIFTYMMLALSLSAIALCAATRPAMQILVRRPGFQPAAALVPVIVIAYYFRAIGDFFRCFLLVEGKPSYDAVCTWLGAALCLAAYFVLIPRFGMWGAATATLITFCAMTVISVVWAYRVHPFRVEGMRLAKILLALAGVLGLYLTVPIGPLALQIVWAVFLPAAFTAALWLMRFQKPGEIDRVRSIALAGWRTLCRKLPFAAGV